MPKAPAALTRLVEQHDARQEPEVHARSLGPSAKFPGPPAAKAQPQPTAQPGTAQPGTAQPGTAQPASAQPASAQPASVQPSSAQPTSAQPASAQPAAGPGVATQAAPAADAATAADAAQAPTCVPQSGLCDVKRHVACGMFLRLRGLSFLRERARLVQPQCQLRSYWTEVRTEEGKQPSPALSCESFLSTFWRSVRHSRKCISVKGKCSALRLTRLNLPEAMFTTTMRPPMRLLGIFPLAAWCVPHSLFWNAETALPGGMGREPSPEKCGLQRVLLVNPIPEVAACKLLLHLAHFR